MMGLEGLCMCNFKKACCATISFVLCFAIACAIIIYPCMMNGSDYNDSAARRELSGQIDYIFLGASHALAAFVPEIIDRELGICSWNLSSPSVSLKGRKHILEKELKRNPIDTVVIDVAYDILYTDSKSIHATGEPMVMCRLDSNIERIQYFGENISLINNDYENVLSIFLRYGLKAWKDLLTGNTGVLQANKGFQPEMSIDVRLNDEEVIACHKRNGLHDGSNKEFLDENVEMLEDIINMCKKYGARVIVAVVPVSDAFIWGHADMSKFSNDLSTICKDNDCDFIDFNLVKTRNQIYSDEFSYINETHMSMKGATAFSENFSSVINCLNSGESIDEICYDSYEELKESMPYMEIVYAGE